MSGDPHRALRRALTMMMPGTEIMSSSSVAWSSNTYTGDRHRFVFRVPVGERERIEAIGDWEFVLPGHLVADIVTHAVRLEGDAAVDLEALTIEDR